MRSESPFSNNRRHLAYVLQSGGCSKWYDASDRKQTRDSRRAEILVYLFDAALAPRCETPVIATIHLLSRVFVLTRQ